MNEFETTKNSSSGADAQSVQEQFQSIHKAIQLLLIAFLVVGGCFTVFLWRQQREMSGQLTKMQPYVKQYDTALLPLVNGLTAELLSYAKSHPDINPLLDKYNVRQAAQTTPVTPAAPTVVLPTVPQPAAPAPPKK